MEHTHSRNCTSSLYLFWDKTNKKATNSLHVTHLKIVAINGGEKKKFL